SRGFPPAVRRVWRRRSPGSPWPIRPPWAGWLPRGPLHAGGWRVRPRARRGPRSSVRCRRTVRRSWSSRCAGLGTVRARSPPYSRGVLLLAIDTATPAVTAGVVSLDGSGALTLAERATVNPRAHGELCTPHLRDAVAA